MNSRAALLFSCPDQSGIIAEITQFFANKKLNIIDLEQHSCDGNFFTRLEWEVAPNEKDAAAFTQEFSPVAKALKASFSVHFFSAIQKLGLFVSKEPHALLEVLTKWETGEFPQVEIPFITSNAPENQKFADRYQIPFYYTPTDQSNAHEAPQLEIIRTHQPDIIGLARYMKVLSADFIDQARCPIVNIHHSFLPSFVGAKPYEMAYERGVKLIGATSHFVIPQLDQGPIIAQGVTPISAGDSVSQLKKMGRDTEKSVFVTALKKVLAKKVLVFRGRTVVFH